MALWGGTTPECPIAAGSQLSHRKGKKLQRDWCLLREDPEGQNFGPLVVSGRSDVVGVFQKPCLGMSTLPLTSRLPPFEQAFPS